MVFYTCLAWLSYIHAHAPQMEPIKLIIWRAYGSYFHIGLPRLSFVQGTDSVVEE